VFQPQYTFTGTPQTYNYVDYNNDHADALAAKAIAATNPDQVAKLWGQVDETVMKDAVVIPIASQKQVLYHSARVQNFIPYALSVQGDWTNLWLKH
jgi:peptide/nickel transport system substrate-binding protein